MIKPFHGKLGLKWSIMVHHMSGSWCDIMANGDEWWLIICLVASWWLRWDSPITTNKNIGHSMFNLFDISYSLTVEHTNPLRTHLLKPPSSETQEAPEAALSRWHSLQVWKSRIVDAMLVWGHKWQKAALWIRVQLTISRVGARYSTRNQPGYPPHLQHVDQRKALSVLVTSSDFLGV